MINNRPGSSIIVPLRAISSKPESSGKLKNGKNAVIVLLMESETAVVSFDYSFRYQKYKIARTNMDAVMTMNESRHWVNFVLILSNTRQI